MGCHLRGNIREPSCCLAMCRGGGGGGGSSSSKSLRYKTELSEYKRTCTRDPELRSFDCTLHQWAIRVVSKLRGGAMPRSLSIDSLGAVAVGLLDVNRDAARAISQLQEDIQEHPALRGLVREYADSNLATMGCFASLGECLERARHSQSMVYEALCRFEREEVEGAGAYSRVVGALKSFKAAGDPFAEFTREFSAVWRQQELMLERLHSCKRRLDRKLRSVRAWRKVSNVIFGVALAGVLVCSVVLAAMSVPPVATALAAAAVEVVPPVGEWFDSLWGEYEDALKGWREEVEAMQAGASFAVIECDGVRALVERLEIQLGTLLNAAEFAIAREEDEVAAKVAVEAIKQRVGAFMASVKDLEKQVDRCRKDVEDAVRSLRTVTEGEGRT